MMRRHTSDGAAYPKGPRKSRRLSKWNGRLCQLLSWYRLPSRYSRPSLTTFHSLGVRLGRVPALYARQDAGCSCKSHEHLAGVFDGARIRMLVGPRQGRGCDQPYSRVAGTEINQRPELVPPHCGHRLIEVADRVLTLAPGRSFGCHHDRRAERMSVHKRCPTVTRGE